MKYLFFINLLFLFSCSPDSLKKDQNSSEETPSVITETEEVLSYKHINFSLCQEIKDEKYSYICPVIENNKNKTLKCKKETNTKLETTVNCQLEKITVSYNKSSFIYVISESDVASCKNDGVIVTTGSDKNKNGLIESGENKTFETICKNDETPLADNECKIIESENFSTIICGDKKIEVKNNLSYSYYDPCGPNGDNFNEVFIKLSNTSYLAVVNYSDKTSFLTMLPKGHYLTNDSQQCHILVNENGSITEIN